MMMMKSSILLAACILLLSSLSVQANQASGPKECCFQFVSVRIQDKRVAGYEYTDDRCSMKAVVFIMKSGKKRCADPTVGWVQEIMVAKD